MRSKKYLQGHHHYRSIKKELNEELKKLIRNAASDYGIYPTRSNGAI